MRFTADQLVTRDRTPLEITIGDGCGAIIHLSLPAHTTQDADQARERLHKLAAVCTAAAAAIGADQGQVYRPAH